TGRTRSYWNTGARSKNSRLGLRELRLRACNRDLVVTRIDLSEYRSGIHVLVLCDTYQNNGTANPRIDGMNVAIYLAVISRLPSGEVMPGSVSANNQNERDRNQQPFGSEHLRHYFPPRNALMVFSAVPMARARDASATFSP